MRRVTVLRSFCPCNICVNFARFDFSQSCSWFLRVVSFRFAIIWLIVSFNSSTSPFASTRIICVSSHFQLSFSRYPMLPAHLLVLPVFLQHPLHVPRSLPGRQTRPVYRSFH